MVKDYGFNGNMGYDMLVDNEEMYREFTRMTSEFRAHHVSLLLVRASRNRHNRHLSWLRLMGLMETWDMIQ